MGRVWTLSLCPVSPASSMAAAHSSSVDVLSFSVTPAMVSPSPLSSMAASHSAASFSSSLSCCLSFLSSSAITFYLQLLLNCGQRCPFMNSQCQFSVACTHRSLVHRYTVSRYGQIIRNFDWNNIACFQSGNFTKRNPSAANGCVDRHVNFLNIFLKRVHPTLVNIIDIALHTGV